MKQDFIIVGGGLVGMITALLLRHHNFSVSLVEQHPFTTENAHLDSRSLVLTQGSKRILASIGLNLADQVTAIDQIHVSQEGGFAKMRLSAAKERVDALGYVIAAAHLKQACWQLLEKSGVTVYAPWVVEDIVSVAGIQQVNLKNASFVLQGECVLIADGADSHLRDGLGFPTTKINYLHQAWVTQVTCQLPHQGIAYQRFLAPGILTLVPRVDPHRMGVIWTTDVETALELMKPENLLSHLQQQMGYRLGKFKTCEEIQCFPLQQVMAKTYAQPGRLLIGNAAHFLNPFGAQGLNLSIRDGVALSDCMVQARSTNQSIAGIDVLEQYAASVYPLHQRIARFIHGISYGWENYRSGLLAELGLQVLDSLPWVKHELARRMMGLRG